ncbi:hypothetical protein V2J09_016357 [Rumex salicifolius]
MTVRSIFKPPGCYMTPSKIYSRLPPGCRTPEPITDSLLHLFVDLLEWNTRMFGSIFLKKRKLWARLDGTRRKYAKEPSQGIIRIKRFLCQGLENVLQQEQIL